MQRRTVKQVIEEAMAHLDAAQSATDQPTTNAHHETARFILDAAAAQHPGNSHIFYMIGTSYLAQSQLGRAITFLERAVDLSPQRWEYWTNLGVTHRQNGDIENARICFNEAIKFEANNAELYNNLAATYIHEGETEEGLEIAKRAVEIDPEFGKARWNLGLLQLEAQNFAEGWDNYSWGVKTGERGHRNYNKGGGTQRLEHLDQIKAGDIVVAYGEQGLGDEILFMSMFAEFKADVENKGATVILDCHPRLMTVFERTFPGIELHGTRKESKIGWTQGRSIQWSVPIGDLGRWYRTDRSQFSDHNGYLVRDFEAGEMMRQDLQERTGKPFLIGLAWTGGIMKTMARYREIPLHEWHPLIAGHHKDCAFISLQYEDCEADIKAFEDEFGIKVWSFPAVTQAFDYDHTFNLVSALDLLITVPTSVLHVAGAIGKETWLVMDDRAAWRECSTDESIIWYPNSHTRFVAHNLRENWSTVLPHVHGALTEWKREMEVAHG